jgi:hypothetical protein
MEAQPDSEGSEDLETPCNSPGGSVNSECCSKSSFPLSGLGFPGPESSVRAGDLAAAAAGPGQADADSDAGPWRQAAGSPACALWSFAVDGNVGVEPPYLLSARLGRHRGPARPRAGAGDHESRALFL